MTILHASFSLHRRGQEHPQPGVSTVQNRQGYCNCCHVHYSNLEQVRQLLHNLAADSKDFSIYKYLFLHQTTNTEWKISGLWIAQYVPSGRYLAYLLPVVKDADGVAQLLQSAFLKSHTGLRCIHYGFPCVFNLEISIYFKVLGL